jgi:hypothetical protein
MRLPILRAAFLLALAAPVAAHAQAPSEILASGTRVRLSVDGEPRAVEGFLASADAGSLRLTADGGEPRSFDVASIRTFARYEDADKRRSMRKWGMALGYTGLSAGLVLGPFAAIGLDSPLGSTMALTGLTGLLTGSVTGVTIGSFTARPGWREYRLVAPEGPGLHFSSRVPLP